MNGGEVGICEEFAQRARLLRDWLPLEPTLFSYTRLGPYVHAWNGMVSKATGERFSAGHVP